MTQKTATRRKAFAPLLLALTCTWLPALSHAQTAPEWNGLISIISENGEYRLDVGARAMKEEVPASHDAWATRLVIRRLDGPSSGPVLAHHVVGLFSADGRVRLHVGNRTMKERVPASHESWATRLRIVPLDGPAVGPVTYERVVGVFSEDAKVRLDLGLRAMKEEVPANMDVWATRLRITPLR